MGKLIDKIKVGMSMKEVRKIIPYKPYMVIPENVMNSQVGETTWIYTNSKGSLKIFFKDAIYTGHEITPIFKFKIRLSQSELIEIGKTEFPLFYN